MTKQIKVSDETYSRLKYLADEAYRTLGGEIDYLVSYFAGEIFTGKNNSIATQPEIKAEITEPAKIGGDVSQEQANYFLNAKADAMKYGVPVVPDFNEVLPVATSSLVRPDVSRTGATIIAGINELKVQIENADMLNQDPDYWATIAGMETKVQELWAEWHQVTGK